MQVVFPDIDMPTRIQVQTERPMNDEEFFDFCALNSDMRIEREPNGEIVIMPPAGFETGYRNSDLTTQLTVWAKKDGRGVALDSNTEYLLPNGAARAPDTSWVLKSRFEKFTKSQKKRFPYLCPDFVVELTSQSDRLAQLKTKMQEWIDNGAQLGWLIDADRRTVHIYRPGQPPEERPDINQLAGEGQVEGFSLDLS